VLDYTSYILSVWALTQEGLVKDLCTEELSQCTYILCAIIDASPGGD